MNGHTTRRLRRISTASTGSESKTAFRALKTLWKRTPAPERHELITLLRMKAKIPAILPWQTKKAAKIAAEFVEVTPLSS